MAENIPPSTTPAKGATTPANADRGLPYYTKLRQDLRDTIAKKRLLDRQLAALEADIHARETTYLEETNAAGNIVKGFDNYIKAAATSNSAVGSGTISGAAAGGTGRTGRKAVVTDSDRIFSRSSVGIGKTTNGEGDATMSGGPGSGVSTPAVGTPNPSVAGDKAERKKKKASRADVGAAGDEEDVRVTKRPKVSFSSGRKREEE